MTARIFRSARARENWIRDFLFGARLLIKPESESFVKRSGAEGDFSLTPFSSCFTSKSVNNEAIRSCFILNVFRKSHKSR